MRGTLNNTQTQHVPVLPFWSLASCLVHVTNILNYLDMAFRPPANPVAVARDPFLDIFGSRTKNTNDPFGLIVKGSQPKETPTPF